MIHNSTVSIIIEIDILYLYINAISKSISHTSISSVRLIVIILLSLCSHCHLLITA